MEYFLHKIIMFMSLHKRVYEKIMKYWHNFKLIERNWQGDMRNHPYFRSVI